ncbi:methyl-accepting chemotaxis protein [Corallococcus sp. CA053C]|uniref:methyl-accepting chemotaxis protein n=1 Tax=Corallococcus sp. CA053C TaxID=2316732 RepID=UPI000EA395E3|nr:methyl-accepting chemotaxis protein [Corallococcus sp. CA053C]RKH09640.1 methyl-accepting chemotaxis protein [Corallococcus sp. CA053C]
MATQDIPGDGDAVSAFVKQGVWLFLQWMSLPAFIAGYLVSVAMGLGGEQATQVVFTVTPPIILVFGAGYPLLSLWWVGRHALARRPGDAPGQRLERLLRLPWRAAAATTSVAWGVGGFTFSVIVAWLHQKDAFQVGMGCSVGACFGVLLAFPFALTLERRLLSQVLAEQQRFPEVAPQGSGPFWPRQRWFLPLTSVTSLVLTLLLSGGVLVVKLRVARTLLEAHLRSLGAQDTVGHLDALGQELLRELAFALAWISVLMLVIPALTLWMMARRQARASGAVREAIESLAAGRVTAPAWVSTDEIGDLASGMRAVLRKLAALPLSLRTAASRLGEAGHQLGLVQEAQQGSLARQAIALQEAQATSGEIQHSSRLAADRAEAVLQVAQRAEALGLKGERSVEASLAGLGAIQDAVDGIQARLVALAESASRIGDITASVKDLADQSNVLALNAAIEAARAGEVGRSFSVVAREMRGLANQSVQATDRIRTVLDDLRQGIQGARRMGEEGGQQVSSGLDGVRTSGASLRELLDMSRESAGAARQIAAAVTQQNAGFTQVFTAVTDLSRIMDETLQRAETTRGATHTLQGVSREVDELARQFHEA